jgi:hypothetical protein
LFTDIDLRAQENAVATPCAIAITRCALDLPNMSTRRKLIIFRSEVTAAAAGFVVQPSLAAQLGVQQVTRRPQTQLRLNQEQDDFDELDLGEY